MIEQTTLHNILTWIIAVILFIFQSLNYFISQIKKFVKHGQKNTTVVTTDTIILSESNPNNNNAPENVITVQGLIQKHFDIPLIIAEDEPKVNDFIKNAQLLTSYDNFKEKKKIDQFMEHLVDDSYVARGLGLITANVGREAEFYLYSKYDNNFENVVIKLKGRQGEIGQITIPNQNPTNSIETKSIPMNYFYDEDRIKVTYTPFAEGVYTLTLVRNGVSICRSPYYISVEKSPTNSRSQIRLGTKKYKTVTKFAKAKHVPLEIYDDSIPVIKPSKPSISRNILPTSEEKSIRTDVMSIVTKFESNSIYFQKNDQKRTVNKSKKSPKTDLFDEISISANSNTQPKIETGNDYNTNINDLSSLSINSNSKSNDKKFSSNLDISNRNSKSSDVNSKEIESNLVKKFNKKLDENIRNINDIPQVKNVLLNHLESTNSVLLKESLNDKSSDDVEKYNQTYKTNKPIRGQNQIETVLDPITVDKSEIKCIDNEACTHNEVSCFDDDDRKTVIVMKNINELESHPKISMNRQIIDSIQYNINTSFTSVLTKITNDVCEKCSIKVLKILSEFPRDINITHNNNSNEICSSFETLLAQPISININIDNLFEKPISLTNEHKIDNLLTNSPTNMKLIDKIDKDIKYHYINEIKPIDTTFNEINCDINNTTTELMVTHNKHDGEINKKINDKITNNFTIPLTKNNIDKHKTDHLENKLSTDNKMQIQVQSVQKFSEYNMDIDKTNQYQFHEYINNVLNDINKENGKMLDSRDLVIINNDKKSNEELVTKELKAKNDIILDEYKNIQSSFINNQTVLSSMEDKLPTSRYKSEDIRQEINNISSTNVILPENQKLIIENSIEPVLQNFKNKIVEEITQLYLNGDLTSSDNTSIFENHNINLTNNLQKNQLYNNADSKKNKTKLIETLRSQLKNHFHKNDTSEIILDKKKTDNNQLYKYLENIIKTNMNQNEIHSQRLDENNFQTIVSIAKNQLNKQQLDNDFKIMTLENVTPNFDIKKTNDDEKVQDTEIKLKNTPNDTSIKIETTTESIKSNTSEATGVESNIDNKNISESIKLKNKVNDLRKIQNIFKTNEIRENNNRDTTIKSKPTENALIEQIKKQEDKVVKIKMFYDAEDLTIEKENIYKFPQLNINENVIIEKPNSEVLVPIKNTNVSKNTAKETKELKIASESPAYNDSKKLNKHKINKEKIENTDKTLENNKSELIISHPQLANDSNPPIIIQLKSEKDDSFKALNTKYKLTTLESTVNKIKCNKIKNKTILPNKSSSTVILTVNKENETSTTIDTSRVTELKLDKITNSAESDKSILINLSIKPQVQKVVVEIVTNNNKTIIGSVTIIIHEETGENKEVANKNNPKTNYWIQINDHEVYTRNGYYDTIEPINKDKYIETEIPKTSKQTDKTIENNLKESNKNEIEKRIKNDLQIETPTIPVQKSEKLENINEIKIIPYTDSSVEIFYKQKIQKKYVQTNKTKQNIEKKNKSCFLIDTSTIPVEQNNIKGKSIEHPLLIENSNKYVKESKVIKNKTEIELMKNSDSSALNKEEPIGKKNNPDPEIETDKSIDKINKEDETSSIINTPTVADEENIIKEETTEKPLPNKKPIKSIKDSKVEGSKVETETSTNTNSSIANIEESIIKANDPETEFKNKKLEDKINKKYEPCSLKNKLSTSEEEKIILEETAVNQLSIETLIKSVEQLKVVDSKAETETSPTPDSLTVNVDELIDKENIPNMELETDKPINITNKEDEPCSLTNTLSTSDEENIILEETVENQLSIETTNKSVDDLKEVNINTEAASISNNESSIAIVDESIVKENIPDSEIKTEKLEDNIIEEDEPCSLTITLSNSEEEKIILEETAENQLSIETPIKSVEQLKVVDSKAETNTSPTPDSLTVNVDEPIDKENIPNMELETDKPIIITNKEDESSSFTDTLSTSDEKKVILEEVAGNQLSIETPIKSVDNLKEVNINTEAASISNNESSIAIVDESIVKENITDSEIKTEKLEDNILEEYEPCSLTNTLCTSDDEKIILEETAENQLSIETPIKSVEQLKVVDNKAETNTSPTPDSLTVNVDEPIDKENIPNMELETDKPINITNKEDESSSFTDTLSTSDEKKVILEEIAGNQLSIETPIKSVDNLKEVNINTEAASISNNESSIAIVDESIVKENIPDSEIKTEKLEDNIIEEDEPCSLTNTLSNSEEEKIISEGTAENQLSIETPIESVDDLKEVNINTEAASISNNESSIAIVDESIVKENITVSEIKTEKLEDNILEEYEPCSLTNTLCTSDDEKIILEETAENQLSIETPIKSVEQLKVVDSKAETNTSPTPDSLTVNVDEPIDKENIPNMEHETDKPINITNKEDESSSFTDTLSTSDEKKVILEEIAVNQLSIDTPIESVDDLKEVNINTEAASISNNESSIAIVDESIVKENIPDSEIKTEKLEDNIIEEDEPCSLTNTLSNSEEEKIILEETAENQLSIETPIKSVEQLKVVDSKAETKTSPTPDSLTVNVDEPIDKENIPNMELETDKPINITNKEDESSSFTDTLSTSEEEKIILEETAVNQVSIETLIKSVDNLKEVNINTEAASISNNESSIAIVDESIVKENIPDSEIKTEKLEDNIIEEDEPCSLTNTLSNSEEEKIISEGTAENQLSIETPIESVDDLKEVNINTEAASISNNESSIAIVDESIVKENITVSEIKTEKLEDNILEEYEPCSLTNTLCTSDDEKIILEETAENQLSIETPIKSVEQLKVVDSKAETNTSPTPDSLTVNVDEPIDKENIPNMELETDKPINITNKEDESSSFTDTLSTSDEKKVILEEIAVNQLSIDTPIESVDDLKEVNINTEAASISNNESSIAIVDESIVKENIPDSEIKTEKLEDNIIEEDEPCSLTNTLSNSEEEKIILEETAENQLSIETPIKSVEQLKVVDSKAETKTSPTPDSLTVNVDEPIDKENIPNMELETDKPINITNKEDESSSFTDTLSTSEEEKIILEETAVNQVSIETLIKSVEQLKVVDSKAETETSPTPDSLTVNVDEPIDKENIPNMELETDKPINITNKEDEPCSLTNTLSTSDEENIISEGTAENQLSIDTPIESVDDLKEVNINTEAASISNNESSIAIVDESIVKENIPDSEIKTEKLEDNIIEEDEPCSLTITLSNSEEEKIISEGTAENQLSIETPIESVDDLKEVNINTEAASISNNESSIAIVDESIVKENITVSEIKTEKLEDNILEEYEPCSLTNTLCTSDDEKIILEETAENQLSIETPIKSVEQLKVVDSKAETNTSPTPDSLTVNVDEPIDKENIPNMELETDKPINITNKEDESSSFTDTLSTSDEKKVILEEIAGNQLSIETPIKSVDNLKEVNINTEAASISNNESSIAIVDESIVKENIPDSEIKTEKLEDNIIEEDEPCSLTNTLSNSEEEKIILEETAENQLSIETPIKSVEQLKVVDSKAETKTSPTPDSLTVNVDEPIDKENIPNMELETDKPINITNKEDESSSFTDTLSTSEEEKIILEETAENQLSIDTPIESVDDLKEVNINTEAASISNNESSIAIVDESIVKENIPDSEIKTEKLEDNIIEEDEPCSLTITLSNSEEEKIISEGTAENQLSIETPIESVDDLKEVNINTEAASISNNESSIAIVDESIVKENITVSEIKTEKLEDNILEEYEPCSLTNTLCTSDDEKIILEETAENQLSIETPIKSVEQLKVVDSKAETNTSPTPDSLTVNVDEPIDKENIPNMELETDKPINITNKEDESSSFTDTLSTSEEEKIILEETAVNQVSIETLIKSVEQLKVVNINTEAASISNNESSIAIVDESIVKENIPDSEIKTEKLEDNIIEEDEPCSLTITLSNSEEEKIISEGTVENQLSIETTNKSVDDLKEVNINTEAASISNNESSIAIVDESIVKENIPDSEIKTEKLEDNIIEEDEPCSLTITLSNSEEEKIISEGTAENQLSSETPIESVDDLKEVNINTEAASISNNESSIANVDESIVKKNMPESEIIIERLEDNIIEKDELCSPTDIPIVSVGDKNIKEKTAEKPSTNKTPIKSVKELNVVNINTETEKSTKTDSVTLNIDKWIDKENIPEMKIEIDKLIDNTIKKDEASLLIITPTISDDQNIIKEQSTENPLPNEPLIKAVEEFKVVNINTEIKSIPNSDPLKANVDESIVKDIIPETELQTFKTIDNIDKESEASLQTDTSSASIDEKNIIIETIDYQIPVGTSLESVEKSIVVDLKIETKSIPFHDSSIVNTERPINKEYIREIQIETDKLIDNSNQECESCSLTDKLAASDKENNLTEETIEFLLPIETSIKSSIKSVEESNVKNVNTETVVVPNIDSSTVNAEEPLDEDYFSKIVIMTDKTLDFIVKEYETCPPIDTSMYVPEEIKVIDDTIKKLIPIGPSFEVVKTEILSSIDGFNTIVNRQSESECFKDIESSTCIDTATFVTDQKVEENGTVIENILTINTSTASVKGQIQVEEVIKDESVILNDNSVKFDEISVEEEKKIETAKISPITVMEEQTDINRCDVMHTCEESLDTTIVEKGSHSESTSTIDILVAVVEEHRALEIEVSENASQVLDDTFTETVENLIKSKKITKKETTTPNVVAKSEVERNEIKVMSENQTSTPVHLASNNMEQTETDMVTEIASPNFNVLNSNTKIILIDKEVITENSDNPKNCYLKFGETSKIHSLENEDNLQGKSYGIQKLEMSVQRMKTSNEDYYEKTFLQLEQTEKFSVENKDRVDCENKNIIDDKLYTVNESDLNAILCASSLEEALTLLDSKIKFKFKHRKLSNKANSTPHIPKIQTSESRSSGTNTNFTDAREFFKEIEKKCKK